MIAISENVSLSFQRKKDLAEAVRYGHHMDDKQFRKFMRRKI